MQSAILVECFEEFTDKGLRTIPPVVQQLGAVLLQLVHVGLQLVLLGLKSFKIV